MGHDKANADIGDRRAFRDRIKAQQDPIRLEGVPGHRRKQKATSPADQFPDCRLYLAADVGQFIELCIHRPRQRDPANHIAVDQGRKARCQQGRAHAVEVLLKIAKSLRPKQKLSDDQQRPTLADELRSTGKRAKLRVVQMAHS